MNMLTYGCFFKSICNTCLICISNHGEGETKKCFLNFADLHCLTVMILRVVMHQQSIWYSILLSSLIIMITCLKSLFSIFKYLDITFLFICILNILLNLDPLFSRSGPKLLNVITSHKQIKAEALSKRI